MATLPNETPTANWLTEIINPAGSTVARYADDDLYVTESGSTNLYAARLTAEPGVVSSLSGLAGGIDEPVEVSLQYMDHDGQFTSLLSTDLRGGAVVVKRYDSLDSPQVTTIARGHIVDVYQSANSRQRRATIVCRMQNPDPLQREIPVKTITQAFLDDLGILAEEQPADDLGTVVPIVFGRAKKVPLRYVRRDTTEHVYDYLICHGTIETSDSTTMVLYRDKVIVDMAAEQITVHDGGAGSPYPGYASIRCVAEQLDFRGGRYTFTADVRGLELGESAAPRSFTKAARHILSNATWGLGLSVDATTWNAAASAEAAVSPALYCDGFLDEPRTAQEVLLEMMECVRGRIYQTASGTYACTVDLVHNATIKGVYGLNDGLYDNIVEDRGVEVRRVPLDHAVSTITYQYGLNPWTGEYSLQTSARTVNASYGTPQTRQLPWVRNGGTADRIACMAMQAELLDKEVTCTLGYEGRDVSIGDVVALKVPLWGIDTTYRVMEAERGTQDTRVRLRQYATSLYTYTAGSIPTDPNDDDEVDYSGTPPSVPTNIAVSQSAMTTAADGTTLGQAVVTVYPVDEPQFASVEFGWSPRASSTYTYVAGQAHPTTAGQWLATLTGLVPGVLYNYAARSVGTLGLKSAAAAKTDAAVMPGDTTAPDAPTNLAATSIIKGIRLQWTPPGNADLDCFEVSRSTDNSTWTTILTNHQSSRWDDMTVAYDTNYYYRVRSKDLSGNPTTDTGWTTSVGPKQPLRAQGSGSTGTTGDVEHIGNADIDNLSADKITAGIIKIKDTGLTSWQCHGGASLASTRDGISYWYVPNGALGVKIGRTGSSNVAWMAAGEYACTGATDTSQYGAKVSGSTAGINALAPSGGKGVMAELYGDASSGTEGYGFQCSTGGVNIPMYGYTTATSTTKPAIKGEASDTANGYGMWCHGLFRYTAPTAGSAGALVGYFEINLGGIIRRVPFYATS